MQCSDCKFWGATRDESHGESFDLGWKECGRMEMLDNVTDHNGSRFVLKPELSGLKAAVQDGSSYYAGLFTAPDFYCSMFEE